MRTSLGPWLEAPVTLSLQAARTMLIGYSGPTFLLERLRKARKRLPARTSALGGLPPRFKAALVRVLTPLSAGFRRELRETQQADSLHRLGLREKDDWQAGGRAISKGKEVAGARGRGQYAHAQPSGWGRGGAAQGALVTQSSLSSRW